MNILMVLKKKIEEIHFEKSAIYIDRIVFRLLRAEKKGEELSNLFKKYLSLRKEIEFLNDGLQKKHISLNISTKTIVDLS